MIAWFMAAAYADPLALRAPVSVPAVIVSAGAPSSSAAWWDGHRGVAFEVHPSLSAIGAAAGVRRRFAGGDTGLVVDGTLAAGLVLPIYDPGVAVSFTPGLQLGYQGESGHLLLGFALPAEVRVAPGTDARVPLLVEVWAGADLSRRISGGLTLGVGDVILPGKGWALTAEAAVTLVIKRK